MQRRSRKKYSAELKWSADPDCLGGGGEIGNSNNNELVFTMFDEARSLYPDAKPIFHSDRGRKSPPAAPQGEMKGSV